MGRARRGRPAGGRASKLEARDVELWTPVRAHAEWITQFRESLYGRASLTPSLVADDEACEVGRWLIRQQNAIGHLSEYDIAKDVHAKLHRRAAHCLELAAAGHRFEALAETENHGEMRQLSRRLVKAFQNLKRQARRQKLPVTWSVDADETGLPRSSVGPG